MEESVGQVLLKVQDDLGRLREQLDASSLVAIGGSGSAAARFDANALQEALAKAETDLRTRSNDVLNRMQVNPVHLPQIRQQQPNRRQDQGFQQQKQQYEPLPTVISAKEAKGGLLALMERGVIPPAANVVLEPQPIRHRQAPKHDPGTRPRDRFPADAADPGYTQEGYQLDESTPVKQNGAVKLKLKNQTAAGPGRVRVQQFDPPMLRTRSAADRMMHHQPAVIPAVAAASEAVQKSKEAEPVATGREQSAVAAPPPPTTPASFAAIASRADAPGSLRFNIQNGRVRREASDFQAFRSRCAQLEGVELPVIDQLLEQLERLLQKFSIPMAQVNGELLCDLAELTEPSSTSTDESELIDCLVNRADVLKLIKRPGRQFVGPGGPERASIVIQKRWRGYRARRDYARRCQRNRAAKAIANQWKLYTRRLEIRAQLKRSRQLHLDGYKRRFSVLQEHWDKWCGKRRVLIHLPSLGYPEKIRAGFLNFNRVQNTQMSRLCDIRDPNVDVVLLSAVAIDDEMTQYYHRLLSGLSGDVQKPQHNSLSNRYKIVVPEAAKVFADRNMPLATLLNYSPKALRRIKNLIQGRPAFIVPGYPCQDDLAVADKLDVPILCPEPQVAQLYSTKSGARRIFRAAKICTPPGDFDVYSLTQLLDSLAKLITANLTVTRWLLKLDSQFDGRGIGFIDVDKLPCYRWALCERRRYGEKWDKKWAQEKVLLRVQEELPELLGSSAARVACPDAYSNWQQFQQEFLSQGGVIEACPPAESVTRLTVDLCIEPAGVVRLLSSGDQLVSAQQPFSCLGISAPQCSVPPAYLNDLCRKVGDACRERRIFGHASVDFVTFEDSETNRQELWATDLSLHYSDTTALSQLFYFSTGGRFDPEQHEVLVEQIKSSEKSRAPIGRRQRRDRGRRYATMSTRLCHSHLSKLQFAAFFKTCKAHGIEFDTKTRTGSLFCLMDPFNRDSVGMATISADLLTSLETFARNLSVIDQELSTPTDQGESNFRGLIDELHEVISAAKENELA